MGTVLPTTLLMLVLIVFFFGIKDSGPVKSMLQAVRPVVVSIVLLTFTKVNPAIIILRSAALGYFLYR